MSSQAYLKLLTKKGKISHLPWSYRPISLIHLDAKFFPKIISSHLAPIFPSLIHPSQTGFVKALLATSNIRKFFKTHECAKLHLLEDLAIITLDAEKAIRQCQPQLTLPGTVKI